MAEDSKKKQTHWAEPIAVLFIIFVLLQIFSFVPSMLERKLGLDTTFLASFLNIGQKLDIDAPIGTKIKNKNTTSLWSEPGTGVILKEIPKGAKGEVIGGPILNRGIVWWQIKYEDGSVGWVSENDLSVDINENKKTLNEGTPNGTKIKNSIDTPIYSDVYNKRIIGNLKKGETGTIVGGPTDVDGERWWQVRYDDGTVGWVPESALERDIERDLITVNDLTPFGTEVVSNKLTEVWSAPRGGLLLGLQEKGATGILLDGSVTIGTNRWWDVDYEEGVDGWVLERDLNRKFRAREGAALTTKTFKNISYGLSLVLLIFAVFLMYRLRETMRREYHLYKPLATLPSEVKVKNDKWDKILEHVESTNPNDWRLSILEADILLDDILTKMSYHGVSVGEKLKGVERSDFVTIDKAWEAHKIRNMIAHEGSDFVLTQREAKRTIQLYKEVFEEFYFV